MGILDVFSRRDWNVLAVTYEGADRYRLNANRRKGRDALQAMKGASAHEGTICWMVFDQKGRKLKEGLGPAAKKLADSETTKLLAGLPVHRDVLETLRDLEQGRAQVARPFRWNK